MDAGQVVANTDWECSVMVNHTNHLPYSWKIWRGIKFGGLLVYITTAKLKSAKISYSHIYVWQSCTEPPNLNQLIFLQ